MRSGTRGRSYAPQRLRKPLSSIVACARSRGAQRMSATDEATTRASSTWTPVPELSDGRQRLRKTRVQLLRPVPRWHRRSPRGAIRCGSISYKGGLLRDWRWWQRYSAELWRGANPDSPQSVRLTSSGAGYRLLTSAGRWRSWGAGYQAHVVGYYDQLVVLPAHNSPRVIDVYIDNARYKRVRW